MSSEASGKHHPSSDKRAGDCSLATDRPLYMGWKGGGYREDWQVSHGIHFGLNFPCSVIYSDAFMHSFCRRKLFSKSGEMYASALWASHACGVLHGPHLWLLRYVPQYIRSTQENFINKCGIKPRRVYQSTMALKL
jgi:hypothetical protein